MPDIAVANECSTLTNNMCANTGSVGVLAGNGGGTFNLPVKYTSSGKDATSVAVANVNGDTKLDILVSNVCFSSSDCSHGNVGVLLNIFKAGVTVQVASSLNPAYINQPFDLTAIINSPVPIPDGSPVNFFYSGNLIGSGTTTGGIATATGISFPVYGPHTIAAKYAGDVYHNAGSGTMTQLVPRYPTTTTVILTDTPEQRGQPVPLTATVSSSGPSVPTGTVTFKSGTTTIGTVPLSGGTATLVTKTLPVGPLTINAFYNGDSQSAPSSGSNTEIIY
jgi:Bacterial Ig-like domain (group 3)/FG-GAP-like repeat